MNIFFFILRRKIKLVLVTVSFYSEIERKKERFNTVILTEKWYHTS